MPTSRQAPAITPAITPAVIRRMNRAYTLPDVFEKGEITPPMREVREWFQDVVFPPGGTP